MNIVDTKKEKELAIKEAVIKAIETGEAQTYQTTTKGYYENGVVVNEWKFTWGIKARK